MKNILIILLLFSSGLLLAQQKTYTIGNMKIVDSSNSMALWNNRDLATTRFMTDTLRLNNQDILINNLEFIPDSIKYVSKKFLGDKSRNTFHTIQNAIDSSGSGCLIVVNPGIYEEYVILKNGVNLYLHEATILYEGQDSLSTVSDSAGAVTCSIFGTGNITRGYIDASVFPEVNGAKVGAVKLYHNSNLYMDLQNLSNLNNNDLVSLNCKTACIMMYQGNVVANIRNMNTDENTNGSSSSYYVYQLKGNLLLNVDSCYALSSGSGYFYGYNSYQVINVIKNLENTFLKSEMQSNTVFTAKYYSGDIDSDSSVQTINLEKLTTHSSNPNAVIYAQDNAVQTINVSGNIDFHDNGEIKAYRSKQFVRARNIFQRRNNISGGSQVLIRAITSYQHIAVRDTISSFYTTIWNAGSHFPLYSPSYSNYDTNQMVINAGIVVCLNDTGHAVLNDYGRITINANRIVSGGYATLVCNGGENNLFVSDSIRSRVNVPTARATGDSCVAVWSTSRAILNINAGVIRADSSCYAMILQDSTTGKITANEISTRYGTAINFSSARSLTIHNANIQSDSIGTSGYYIATILIGSDNLKLKNCQITTIQSGAAYSVSGYGGATTFEILGLLQANKLPNSVCNTKGMYVQDGELLVDVCGADGSISSKGFTELGNNSPPIKLVLIKGTMPSSNTTKTYTHGFAGNDFRKIIAWSVQVRDDTTGTGNSKIWTPNTSYPLTYNYQAYIDSLNCIIDLGAGLGTKLYSDSVFILVTYTQ